MSRAQAIAPARPRGVAVLAVLCGLAGVGLIGLPLLLTPEAEAAFASGGLSARAVLVLLGGIGLVAILDGLGLWWRERWAWGLTAFVGALLVFRGLAALLLVPVLAGRVALPHGLDGYVLRAALRLLAGAAGLLYLFRPGVRAHFGLPRENAGRAAVRLGAAAAGLIAALILVQGLRL